MRPHTKSLIAAQAIAFLDNFGLSIVFILFAPLILNPEYGFFSASVSDGVKNLWLGILVGIFPFFLFFGAPFWGDVGDRWGRKKALVYTILGTVCGHLLSAVAIFYESYLFLLLARAFAGFLAGNISICLATISDVSEEGSAKGRNFGFLTVFMGIGWILAMLVGGYLSDPNGSSYFSPSLPFYLAAGLNLIGYLIVQFLFIETHRPKTEIQFHLTKSFHDIKAALGMDEVRPLLYLFFIWSTAWYFTFQWFTPISLEKFGVTQETVSTHLALLGICWCIGGVLLNPFLVKKIATRFLAMYAVAFVALFIFLMAISSSFALFSLFFAFSALGAPIAFSNIMNLLSSSAPSGVQGKVMGFSQSFQALSGVVVPFAGGLIANLSISAIYPVSVLLLLVTLAFLALSRKK